MSDALSHALDVTSPQAPDTSPPLPGIARRALVQPHLTVRIGTGPTLVLPAPDAHALLQMLEGARVISEHGTYRSTDYCADALTAGIETVDIRVHVLSTSAYERLTAPF